jgi:hypothetical protein
VNADTTVRYDNVTGGCKPNLPERHSLFAGLADSTSDNRYCLFNRLAREVQQGVGLFMFDVDIEPVGEPQSRYWMGANRK